MNQTTSDLMFHGHRLRAFLHRSTFFQSSPNPKCHLLLQLKPYPSSSPHSLFSTTTADSDKQSFTVSYLTNNCGFSPQAAAKASKRVRFDNPQKPDSVIAFFTNHGFSISQTHSVVGREPELLVCDPTKRVLPKFQFLASKGASASDIVTTVARRPRFLRRSLENQIVPSFESIRRFFPSDEKTMASLILCPNSLGNPRVEANLKLLLQMGVAPSNIHHLLTTRPSVLSSPDLDETVEEIKGLGFDPSKTHFGVALLAKKAVSKSQWDAKLDAFRTWGWSEDDIISAFKKDPRIMLRSIEKLNAVMSFWVGQLGWDPSMLLASPVLFGLSLEKRLMPRASVVQYLLSRGLMKKDASLLTPFILTEKFFMQKFVKCFEEEETSKLLSLYQGAF